MFNSLHSTFLGLLAQSLAAWRQGRVGGDWVRELYRSLGHCFVPMRERRRLLFPDRAKP